MKKNAFITIIGTALLVVATTSTAFAGVWKQDDNGWWYQRNDGSYPQNQWEWIDADHDAVYESYYFDSNGYRLTNTVTPDGYTVNEDGACVENGVVKTQELGVHMDLDTSNHIDYSLTEYNRLISRNLSPTYLCIYDDAGTPLTYSYRSQSSFSLENGNGAFESQGFVKLEKNKEYYLEGIVSAYSKAGIRLNWPRLFEAYLTSIIDESIGRPYYYDLEIAPLTPVSNVNQSPLKDKQVVEGNVSGDVIANGNRKIELLWSDNYGWSYEYAYTGVCFRSEKFVITDDMPDEGYIHSIIPMYYNYYDSNQNFLDDDLAIWYVIKDSEKDTMDLNHEYDELAATYDERGINKTLLDMINSTKEENADKYTVVEIFSCADYDIDGSLGTSDQIYYKNGVSVCYDVRNRPTRVSANHSPNNYLYQFAPDSKDYPIQMNKKVVDEMLHKYADSVGFIYDGWGQVRTDGLKTFNTSPETGLISLYFNNEDNISISINGLGKKTEYSIGLCRFYTN